MKKAFITGITGQDGSYLSEFLLNKGHEVHGLVRRVALENPEHRLWRINHIKNDVCLHPGSIENYASVCNIINEVKPNECYHLAAQSFVTDSFEDPFSTLNININGTLHILEAIRQLVPTCRFYFAGSSEQFGNSTESIQTERTPFHPRSPYGVSKVAGFNLTRNYREAYNLFACSGICFNHESPRRGLEFVTRKITNYIANLKLGQTKEHLKLGNLDALRDWGFAGDYVKAMNLMLQQEKPIDYVIATNTVHTVQEFIDIAFNYIGIDPKEFVIIDPHLYRPADIALLKGDYSKIRNNLSWKPTIEFEELIKMMIDSDIDSLSGRL